MKYYEVLRNWNISINNKQSIARLYVYAPVYRFNYGDQDYVLKRTGVRSNANAIAAWTDYLISQGIESVAPVKNFGQNPRCFLNKKNKTEENWVIYPFVGGIPYRGDTAQILAAGKLLGKIHAAGMKTNFELQVSKTVIAIKAEKIELEITEVCKKIEQYAPEKLENAQKILTSYSRRYWEYVLPKLLKIHLPLTNCSWDYKAANLVYQTDHTPVLIDPDHAGRIPRMYDLATALLLFNCDLPSAPKRIFTPAEWTTFLKGYKQYIQPTTEEKRTWNDLLLCAWIDQALWLLAHFPQGWADLAESRYLLSVLTGDFSDFSLSD